MKRATLNLAAWLTLSALIAASSALMASAQSDQRVKTLKFEKGQTTATLKGTADNAHGFTYMLAANKGQTMTVHLTATPGGSAIFSLTAPGGAVEGALEVTDWTGTLPDTGTYLIAVWNKKKRGRAIPYTIEITIK